MIVDIDGREIGAWCNLADMCTEWALCLVGFDVQAGVRKIEVVVALGIVCEGDVVEHRGKIDRSTLEVEKYGHQARECLGSMKRCDDSHSSSGRPCVLP